MAARFEVFDKLRELGKSLDEASKITTKLTEEEPQQINKARACLKLRGILADANNFKKDSKRKIEDTKKRFWFDQFLSTCEKQAGKMKEDIENLEEYLEKYGYKRQTEKLPDVQVDSLEDFDVADSSGQSSSGSPQNNSDKENQLYEIKETVNIAKEDEKEESNHKEGAKEVDLLSTPVRPVTVTKLIQDLCPQRDDIAASPDLSKLVPPSTTTPLMKSLAQGQGGDSNFNTPDSSTELLVAPATRTPLIKADQSDSSTPIPKIDNSPTDDFPTPPTFTTPGLQKYGSKKHCEHSLLKDAINTPPPLPPTFSTVHLLIPGEKQNYQSSNPKPASGDIKRMFIFPEINEEAYLQLPECLQRQFSLEQVNQFIEKTGNYLSTEVGGKNEFVSDEELMAVLDLGPRTRAFILLMIKLNYFTIVQKGLYKVLL